MAHRRALDDDTVYIYSMTTLAELIRHFELYGVCIECRRMERIDIASLIANGESALRVEQLRSRVRCRHCRRRTNDIRIVYAGPCGHARGFHYRD